MTSAQLQFVRFLGVAVALSTIPQLAAQSPAPRERGSAPSATRCARLVGASGFGVERAAVQPAGQVPVFMGPPANIPRHCELFGHLDDRVGIDGQRYAIRYHLRMPEKWNRRFFFQGGGGTNGEIGDAVGMIAIGAPVALSLGYAVVSQDSGHDNEVNSNPARGGQAAFGADPIARANYGQRSLQRVADVAKAAVTRFYGRAIERSYFVGCSKGGQEGMAFAQQHPDTFDGIIAAAPGISLPKAALAQVWDVQTFGSLVGGSRTGLDVNRLAGAFSTTQLASVRGAILKACDALDGLADGITGSFAECTWRRVEPELRRVTCSDAPDGACLAPRQIAALRRSLDGPRGAQGSALYTSWPWDAGVGSDGWRMWKLGNERMPALNVVTGGAALSMIFTTPPTAVRGDPASLAAYAMSFDFGRSASRIFATNAAFPRSAWQDVAARSADLRAFRARGGKMIVPHGAADPVFSINDTIAWYGEVQRMTPNADSFVRVFPVPGMAHCGGGPATGNYDAFAALVDWVEHQRAPDRIIARAGPDTPWPNRSRPLCPFPRIARYSGKGSIDEAANFICKEHSL